MKTILNSLRHAVSLCRLSWSAWHRLFTKGHMTCWISFVLTESLLLELRVRKPCQVVDQVELVCGNSTLKTHQASKCKYQNTSFKGMILYEVVKTSRNMQNGKDVNETLGVHFGAFYSYKTLNLYF